MHSQSGSRVPIASALVVEDDPAMATALADLLAETGYHPVLVRTVHEAEAAIRTDRPEVVLLDLSLEESFGTELLEALAKDDEAPAVVIVSGFRLAPLVAERFSVELVEKPFADVALHAALQRAIAGRTRPKLAHA